MIYIDSWHLKVCDVEYINGTQSKPISNVRLSDFFSEYLTSPVNISDLLDRNCAAIYARCKK